LPIYFALAVFSDSPLIFPPSDQNVKLRLHNNKKPTAILTNSKTLSIEQVISSHQRAPHVPNISRVRPNPLLIIMTRNERPYRGIRTRFDEAIRLCAPTPISKAIVLSRKTDAPRMIDESEVRNLPTWAVPPSVKPSPSSWMTCI
jgi:hypothetical protein